MQTLGTIRDAVSAYAAGFDVSRTTTSDCAEVVRQITAIEAALSVVKAEAAAKVAASGTWRQAGARSAAEHVARTAGTTIGAASTLIDTGRALDSAPAVREAAVTGALSATQAALIADAVSADAPSAGPLISQASWLSLGELRSECAKAKAAADPDPRATRARIHAERSFRRWDDGNGKGFVQLVGPVTDLVLLEAAIAPARERLFQQAHRDGRPQRNDALDYDALLATVRDATPTADSSIGADTDAHDRRRVRGRWWNAKVIIRVDHTALLRGRVVGDETCDINGSTPIPVEDVREAIRDDAFVAVALTRGRQVTGVAHLGRRPTALQQTALEWQSPTCSAEGCNRTARQTDHREPWAVTKHTLLEELDRFCDHCHDRKTYDHWALVPGVGKRPFVSPDDPRHPGHDRRPATAAASS